MGLFRKASRGVALVIVLVVAAFLLGFLSPPSVGVSDIGDWGSVSEERTEIVTTLWVNNPNPVGASFGDGLRADYYLEMNGVRVARGQKSGVSVPPGNNTVTLRTDLDNDKLVPWWVTYVRRNETITAAAGGDVTVDAGLSARASIPPIEREMLEESTPVRSGLSAAANGTAGTYTASGGDVAGGVLGDEATVGYEIRRGWATWGTVNESETTVVFHFLVHNPGDVPVPGAPDGFRLNLRMNDVTLFTADGGELSPRNAAARRPISPGETREVTYAVRMDNEEVDDWFRSHVRRGERTELQADMQLVFRVGEIGVEFAVPPGGVTTTTCDIRTAILVDDQVPETTCGGPAGLSGSGETGIRAPAGD